MEIIRIPLNYGSIAGICYFAIFLILYLLGHNPLGGMTFWYTFWIPIVFVTLAIKKYRDELQDGFITYGKALRQGTLTALIYSSFYAIMIYIFAVLVDGTIVDQVIADGIEQLEKQGERLRGFMGEEAFDRLIEETERVTIGSIALSDFFYKFLGGFIISLIVAAILKRTRSPFEEDETVADE
jgi:hypothetical protein